MDCFFMNHLIYYSAPCFQENTELFMRDQGTIWFCTVLGALWDAVVSKVVGTYACNPASS